MSTHDEHIPSFSAALSAVAVDSPGSSVKLLQLFGSSRRHLRRSGLPTIPLSAFKALLRRTGYGVHYAEAFDPDSPQYVHGLSLRS